MVGYHKIETLYNRNTDGSKGLVEGDWRDPTVQFLADLDWEWTEKIDGTNISVVWDGHKVEFHGRTERANIPAHLVNKLLDMFGGETNEELFEQKFGETPAILFGEGYGVKIQSGGSYIPDGVSFILFDVFMPEQGNWLPREAVNDIATYFNIDAVPVVGVGPLSKAVEFVKTKPKSTIGTANMEGVVCRPVVELRNRCGNRAIVKIKVRDFTDNDGK